MSDLKRRIARLEALHPVPSEADAEVHARHQRRMTGLVAFIGEAFPDRRECIAYHVAQIFGLPDSRAMQAYLRGQSLEAIACDRYGTDWETKMEATGAAAAVHCEAAHGPGWAEKFLAIWCGEGDG